ncbi:MAG: hypothetical protein ACI9VR_003151 [Cognaticolwellia sp.]|jgi:hypothetical protein
MGEQQDTLRFERFQSAIEGREGHTGAIAPDALLDEYGPGAHSNATEV